MVECTRRAKYNKTTGMIYCCTAVVVVAFTLLNILLHGSTAVHVHNSSSINSTSTRTCLVLLLLRSDEHFLSVNGSAEQKKIGPHTARIY